MKNAVKAVSMSKIAPVIEEIIKNGSDVCIPVTGMSMYPMLRNCIDSVVLTKPEEQAIKKYSIALYKRNHGQYVLHRIIRVKNDELYLNGDNQTVVERNIFKHQAIALVKGFYRNENYISCNHFLYKIYAWFWVAALPIRGALLRIYLFLIKKILKRGRRK